MTFSPAELEAAVMDAADVSLEQFARMLRALAPSQRGRDAGEAFEELANMIVRNKALLYEDEPVMPRPS